MKECPQCHKQVPDSSKYCPHCGYKYEQKDPDTGSTYSSSSDIGPTIFKIIFTIIILAVCIVACFFYGVGVPLLAIAICKVIPDIWRDKY